MALIIQSSLESGFKKTHLKWFHMLKQGLHVMICWVKDAIGFFFIYWYYLWHVYKACLFGTFLRLNRHLQKSKVSVNVSIQMGGKRACLCEHLPMNLYLSGIFFSLPDVMFHFCVDFKIYIITTNTYVTYTARSLGHRVYG